MNKAIGGYIGLELRQGTHYHANALPLNTGRNCFEYILKLRGYNHVLLLRHNIFNQIFSILQFNAN